MTATTPQDVTTPPPSPLPSRGTLYRLAVREALSQDQPGRVPGRPGPHDWNWINHRHKQLMERYGVADERTEEG